MKTKSPDEARAEGTDIKEWFKKPDCDRPARRHEIWTLLGWYHNSVVKPNMGIAGVFRRLWWRLTGQRGFLMSPWEIIHERAVLNAIKRAKVQAEVDEANAAFEAKQAAEQGKSDLIKLAR